MDSPHTGTGGRLTSASQRQNPPPLLRNSFLGRKHQLPDSRLTNIRPAHLWTVFFLILVPVMSLLSILGFFVFLPLLSPYAPVRPSSSPIPFSLPSSQQHVLRKRAHAGDPITAVNTYLYTEIYTDT